jgi:hypothetical protein
LTNQFPTLPKQETCPVRALPSILADCTDWLILKSGSSPSNSRLPRNSSICEAYHFSHANIFSFDHFSEFFIMLTSSVLISHSSFPLPHTENKVVVFVHERPSITLHPFCMCSSICLLTPRHHSAAREFAQEGVSLPRRKDGPTHRSRHATLLLNPSARPSSCCSANCRRCGEKAALLSDMRRCTQSGPALPDGARISWVKRGGGRRLVQAAAAEKSTTAWTRGACGPGALRAALTPHQGDGSPASAGDAGNGRGAARGVDAGRRGGWSRAAPRASE